jgi:hypothetical protein
MKNKKKDTIPLLKPGEYGERFMGWWKNLQPSWRTTESQPFLPLSHDVPSGETWQIMRKGGTAGIYIVVMGLSWWVMTQHVERDVNVSSIVEDLTWVIKEMKKYMAPPQLSQKRPHDEEDEDEGQRRKRYGFDDVFVTNINMKIYFTFSRRLSK